MKKVVTSNWLSVIKAKKDKENKKHTAQLCMAGHCPTKVK